MRKLSANYMDALQNGFLSGILKAVQGDKDIDLQIRDNYLNLYFKGDSLLKLSQGIDDYFTVDIHPKFTDSLALPSRLTDENSTNLFLKAIPLLKENIIRVGKSSLEVEYEQLIIRANNREMRNNSEYFLVDRQYSLERERFDLMGFFWDRNQRRKGQTVSPCLMEVKFALNANISRVHDQLQGYYQLVKDNIDDIVADLETTHAGTLHSEG